MFGSAPPNCVLSTVAALSASVVLACQIAVPQQSHRAPRGAPTSPANVCAPPMNWTAEQDRRNMMALLGIRILRPGPSGNEKAPDHANYDESKANPFPDLPDPLTLNNGEKVTTAKMWWEKRR